jgi:hypothetical protein
LSAWEPLGRRAEEWGHARASVSGGVKPRRCVRASRGYTCSCATKLAAAWMRKRHSSASGRLRPSLQASDNKIKPTNTMPIMSMHQSTASSPSKAPLVAGRVIVSRDIDIRRSARTRALCGRDETAEECGSTASPVHGGRLLGWNPRADAQIVREPPAYLAQASQLLAWRRQQWLITRAVGHHRHACHRPTNRPGPGYNIYR